MNALKTIGRTGAIFGLLFVTLNVGTFLTSFLPSPPGRYIFTPANEIGVGALLLLVSWAVAFWRWPRPLDLLLAWITSQLAVVLIVAFFTGFSSIFIWWVIHISRFITPTIALGMIVGVTMRGRRRNRNGQPSPPPYGSPGAGSPSGEAGRRPREMKTYSRLLIPVLIACVVANAAGTSLDAKHLIEIAERHDLPMPPAGARLVLAHTEAWSVLGNQSTSRDPGIYSPAYMLKEDADGSIRVLRGAEQDTLQARHNQEPLWRPFSTDKVDPKLGGHVASFSRLSAFVCAVQTAALGDQETAQAIWERFSGGEWWSDARFGEDIAKQLKDQKLLLGRCIFDHMRNALLEAGADRQVIHTRMTALLKEFPTLKTDWRAQLYEDLTTTVKAAPLKTGSVEALLLDWASRPSNMRHLGMHSPHTRDADAPAREILSRGLDTVPELLDLLKDQRVTAHEQQAFMKAPPRIKRVGELARQLVRQIAGDQATFPRYGDDTEAIRAWWEKVRTQDESTALLAGVFNRKDEEIAGVNEGPIRIVAKKFPDKLPGLCAEFTAHATPGAQPYHLAEALAESSLPKEVRVRELSKFAERGSLEHKRCVLQNLAKLDARACAALLLPIFAELPKDATGPYWTCPEANFTHVVVQIEDDEVWRAYLQVAKRCSIGLRMEMMNPMDYCYIGTKNLARRLAFLSAFLDDNAVRKMSGEKGQFEGPCAGFTIPRLAVRDLSAMKLAALLGMKEAPDEFWTNDQWAELRRKVKEHLKDQKLPEL